MKKLRSIIMTFCKIVTIYVVIFFISFLSLSFQVRKSTVLSQTALKQYAEELNADNVYQIGIDCDCSHFEIIVKDIGDINQRLADVMYFQLKHNLKTNYFLFISPEHSLSIIINEQNEMFYEYN